MKKVVLIVFLVLVSVILYSCGKEEVKPLELYNPEAFAFQLENEWELNASVMVRHYKQEETEDGRKISLTYYINLVTPDSTLIKAADYGEIKKELEEEMQGGYQVESQIILDSNFTAGEYRIEFVVEDNLKMEEAALDTTFELVEY